MVVRPKNSQLQIARRAYLLKKTMLTFLETRLYEHKFTVGKDDTHWSTYQGSPEKLADELSIEMAKYIDSLQEV